MAASSSAKQGSEMPAFSYAQAAKGLHSGSSAAQQSKPAASPSDQQNTAAPDEAEAPENAWSDTRRASVNGTDEIVSKQTEPIEEDTAKKPASRDASPSDITAAAATTLPKEDDPSSTPNGTSDSTWDKQSQVSSTVDRSSQTTEVSKDKQPETESGWEKNPPQAKELKAAPIPTVNVWQQRREAQEAKAKAMSALNPAPAPSSSQPTAAKPVDARGTNDPKPASRREPSGTATEHAGGGTSSKDKRKQTAGSKQKSDGEYFFFPSVSYYILG